MGWGKNRRKLTRREWKERRIALAWALPPLLFLGFPVTQLFNSITTLTAGYAALLASFLLFSAMYIAIWVLNPPAPRSPMVTKTFAVSYTALVVLKCITTGILLSIGGSNGAGLISYIVAATLILSPRTTIPYLSCIPLALLLIDWITDPNFSYFMIPVILTTVVMCGLARFGIEQDRHGERQHQQDLLLSRESERARISADLHDILGHTLTGISIKADLAGRLIDAGHYEDARAHIDELTELSREALADVRTVVIDNRTLQPDDEIKSARSLTQAAGAEFTIKHEGDPIPGHPSTLVAYVIREGVTNALRHATPSLITVTLRRDGVRVWNDGVFSTHLIHRIAHQGSGIQGLRERVGNSGTLTAHADRTAWILDLTLTANGSYIPPEAPAEPSQP